MSASSHQPCDLCIFGLYNFIVYGLLLWLWLTTFSLGAEGNLVLAEADGWVVWQMNIANKGVVRFESLPIGNRVFKYQWCKLMTRALVENIVDRPYNFVMESRRMALYYTSKNSPCPMVYCANYLRINLLIYNDTSVFTKITLVSEP
ncbi:hypothetical protein QVD17_05491 [Tagetes erecta]|uniref:Uncharacterized protein n=1 Tax=Tagetes erecta TaxID=13708 RepID=A0AAD8LIC1_TARER|nr:hypothetical protein QVD17_05491 [Tagetes erecta]